MRRWAWVMTVVTVGIGCAGSDGVSLDDSGTTPHTTTDCTGAEPFTVGISDTSSASGATVAITGASPIPPDVGDNAWTVTVTDAGGGPLAGLPVVVTPWMPLHGHGLSPATYAGADQGDGTYTVEPFDLIMPGLWEFTIELGAGDAVTFSFCAEG